MEKIKKILILSTSNPYKTAGIAAYDIFRGFKDKGYNVKLVVENYGNYEDNIISIQSKFDFKIKTFFKKIKNRIKIYIYKLFKIKNKYETFQKYTFDDLSRRKRKYLTKKILSKAEFIPDVIIVIFSQYFISYKNLKELQEMTNAPIYWQFADMFPFTGGCHYAWDCLGFESSCNNCPAFVNEHYSKISNKELLEKRDLIKNMDITAVIGSDWLIKRAQKSFLFKNKPIKKIYLSLDKYHFSPFEIEKKEILRQKYNIDRKKFIILLMASYLNHERKGINLILEALSNLNIEFINKKNLHLLIVGRGFKEIKDKIPYNFQYNQIEFVDREYLPEIYNLSNIFVSASLQEVGPYTLTEALLCAIPVVSLSHGYAGEFVKNNETGILVEDDSPKSLAKAIIEIINIEDDELIKIKKNCRERTKNIISKSKQIKDYIELINNR